MSFAKDLALASALEQFHKEHGAADLLAAVAACCKLPGIQKHLAKAVAIAHEAEVVHVCFRVETDKAGAEHVLAVFPFELGTNSPSTMSAYAHIGQHSSADHTYVVNGTRPATEHEYRALAAELTRIGYKLRVSHCLPHRSYEVRHRKIKESYSAKV